MTNATPQVWYFFRQTKADTPWLIAPATERERIVRLYKPPLTTILDVDNDFNAELSAAELDALRYRGPLYMDFDGSMDGNTVTDAASDLVKVMNRLEAMGVDLDQCRLYASGGRGFHLEIPEAIFMAPVPKAGTVALPAIYKRMVEHFPCDTLDRKIYSAKRGRQWRTPNVQRPNNMFKVQITADEARHMTPETYSELCSAPRPLIEPKPPRLCLPLMSLFREAQGQAASKPKRAANDASKALRQRFQPRGAALPPSLLALCEGRIPPRQGIGFNKIALQVCLAALAMGLDRDRLITLCAGLIRNHQSDGTRYNTPTKRKDALIEMFRYAERSNYVPSIGGIRSILPHGLKCADLRGL